MYELIVLGQLVYCPRHGYMIAKIIGDIIGPFRRVQWGSLYPLLSRLERDGLIRAEVPSKGSVRSRKVYAITDAGKRRLHQLLMDTEHHLSEYDEIFRLKVCFFCELRTEERFDLIDHYARYASENIGHAEAERREMEETHCVDLGPDRTVQILTVMDRRIAYWRGELAWTKQLIGQLSPVEEAG